MWKEEVPQPKGDLVSRFEKVNLADPDHWGMILVHLTRGIPLKEQHKLLLRLVAEACASL